ncbi:MAG: hypothetical protein SGJ18_13125 [Pseudomonadota bacterium]|nr:hypothetical protein [Pseudomonadota bacterium]
MNKQMKFEMNIAKTGDAAISLADQGSAELVSYYLRDVRGRVDLASEVQRKSGYESFTEQLEAIRTHIANEDYKKAKEMIDSCVTESIEERSELSLERARYYFYTLEYGISKEILQHLIVDRDVLLTTKITSYELLGQSYYHLGHTDRAVSNLKKSLNYLDYMPFVISSYVAGAHLVKIKSEQNKFSEAKEILDYLKQKLRGIKQDEIWLARNLLVARGYCHYLKRQGKVQELRSLLHETLAIALWLGDLEMTERCRRDLKDLGEVELKSKNINFLEGLGVLLITNPKSISRFENSPTLSKVLICLLRGEKTLEDLFTDVYDLKYDKERHDMHLRALLSKLRKKLPPNALQVKAGLIKLG